MIYIFIPIIYTLLYIMKKAIQYTHKMYQTDYEYEYMYEWINIEIMYYGTYIMNYVFWRSSWNLI